jgi:phosphotransacetylase
MALNGFDHLFREADERDHPIRIAVAGAADRTVLEALRAACDRGWVAPVLVDREGRTRETAAENGIDLHGLTILDADQPAAAAVALVRKRRACVLMKGHIATPALMHAILDRTCGLRSNRVICQVVLMEVAPSARRFLLADTGICISPLLEEKIDIARHAVAVAHALDNEKPNIAVMAATESVVATMPETVDAEEIQRLGHTGVFGNCAVRGPVSFDLAYAPEAAAKKHIGGPVIGTADIMLFPNLLSANLTVKAIMYTAECRFGGILCGAACPVVFMSRADSTSTRLNSLALALRLVD